MLLLVLCLCMVRARRGVAPVHRQACEESKQESTQHHRMKIQTWRLARSMPMQTEYACAMAVAYLTPQTKTWRQKNHPHPEESECLTTKNKNFTCTNRYEGIIPTK